MEPDNRFLQGAILYFDPFIFLDGGKPKPKYFLVLKRIDDILLLASLPTSKAVVKELKKYIPQYDKTEQFLGNQKWVEEMTGEGRQEQAREYAEKMDTTGGSYTKANKVFPHIEQQ